MTDGEFLKDIYEEQKNSNGITAREFGRLIGVSRSKLYLLFKINRFKDFDRIQYEKNLNIKFPPTEDADTFEFQESLKDIVIKKFENKETNWINEKKTLYEEIALYKKRIYDLENRK